jgi:hypothetical protein
MSSAERFVERLKIVSFYQRRLFRLHNRARPKHVTQLSWAALGLHAQF